MRITLKIDNQEMGQAKSPGVGKGGRKLTDFLKQFLQLWPYSGKACKCQKVNFSGEQK